MTDLRLERPAFNKNLLVPRFVSKCTVGQSAETFTALDSFPSLTYAGRNLLDRQSGILQYDRQTLGKTITQKAGCRALCQQKAVFYGVAVSGDGLAPLMIKSTQQ